MTRIWLVWRLLKARAALNVLTVSAVAIGTGMVVGTASVADGAKSAVAGLAERYPMVVGGKVGGVALVLGALTRLHDLGEGVDYTVYNRLKGDPRVEKAVPLVTGHSIKGYSLLATTPEYFEPRNKFPLSVGRLFKPGTMEAVVGREAGLGLQVQLGTELKIEHHHPGEPGQENFLTVVGILERTGTQADRTVFCSIGAIFKSHEHHGHGIHGARNVSAILVKPKNDQTLLALQEELESIPGIGVALSGQTLSRISERLDIGYRLVKVLVYGIATVVLLSLLLSVYGTALAHVGDAALMRVMGAPRSLVAQVMFMSTMAVALAGAVLGLGAAWLMVLGAKAVLASELGLEAGVSVLTPGAGIYLFFVILSLGVVSLLPAAAAYKVEAAEALSDLPGAGRAVHKTMSRAVKMVLVLFLVFWFANSGGAQQREFTVPRLDSQSREFFKRLPAMDAFQLKAMDGNEVTLQGYMWGLGHTFEVKDFYLVGIDPRLPRCPFCYKAPGPRQRIRVITRGRTFELFKGPVSVSGTFRVRLDQPDPFSIELKDLEVVLP